VAQRAELTGEAFSPATVAGHALPGLVIDLDASVVVCHSEKEEHAAPTFKKTFGHHPMLAFCENTDEFLAGQLRRGNASSNTAAGHIAVLDASLAQSPGPSPPWHHDPDPCRHRRLHPRVPRSYPRTPRRRGEQQLLCRVGDQGQGAGRDRCHPE